MANRNEFLIGRTAFGKFALAASENTANHSSNVLTLRTEGVYIPSGAIVTGIRTFAAGAVTASGCQNATLNAYIGTLALGTNNVVASVVVAQTVAGSINAAGSGVYVPTGGTVAMVLASSGAARSGIVLDGDVYVDYIYCGDRDSA